jgi:hypothetical protein
MFGTVGRKKLFQSKMCRRFGSVTERMIDWTVTSFNWQQQIADRYADAGIPADSRDVILTRLFTLVDFLQRNGLTKRRLIASRNQIDESFAIRASDLTDEGVRLIRACHTKWAAKSKSPDDTAILEKNLQKIRKG